MDLQAFYKLTYGLYIVSSFKGEKPAGCIINTAVQVTADPVQLAVTVNKKNYTAEAIQQSGYFTVAALTQNADMDLIGTFGFHSSRDTEKFENFRCKRDENGVLYVLNHTAARFSCKVVQTVDLGTHIMFIGEATGAETLSDEPLMTYEYYHKVKKGGTPKNAPSYKREQEAIPAKKGFRCTVCGYILEADELPADFKCPICGQGADRFVPVG